MPSGVCLHTAVGCGFVRGKASHLLSIFCKVFRGYHVDDIQTFIGNISVKLNCCFSFPNVFVEKGMIQLPNK